MLHAMGDAVISCCGIILPRLEEEDTEKKIQVERLYPESEALSHFNNLGPGKIFAYCNHHGLFMKEI